MRKRNARGVIRKRVRVTVTSDANIDITRRWFQCGARLVCAPPKCGGTALYCAALGLDPAFGVDVFTMARRVTEFFTPDEVVDSKCDAIQAVRDPVSRFMSLWRSKCRIGDVNLPKLSGLSPDELMEFIKSNPEANAHWLPQVYFYRPGFRTVPYRFMCVHLGVKRFDINKSVTLETDPPAPLADIRRHYKEDIALCSQ